MNGTVYMLSKPPFIKLGFTDQIPWTRRLHQIRNASPDDIEVLAARPATYEQEQDLHRGAEQWKHKGDWYHDSADLRLYCDRFFFADREIIPGIIYETLPAGSGDEPPAAGSEDLSVEVSTHEPLFGDGEDRFRRGTEAAAKLTDKLAKGIISGAALPSCANPIMVSGALAVLAEQIRKLKPTS